MLVDLGILYSHNLVQTIIYYSRIFCFKNFLECKLSRIFCPSNINFSNFFVFGKWSLIAEIDDSSYYERVARAFA